MSDESELRKLNDEYIQAFMRGDSGWYAKHLAADFVCIESDGSVLGKDMFIANAAKGPDVADYRLEQVDVRFLGASSDVAQVRATGRWTRKDGSTGASRYIDVYERRAEGWVAVSAQVTRSAK